MVVIAGNADYCDLTFNRSTIRYSYTPKQLAISSVSIGYSYATQFDDVITPAFTGRKAAVTQSILNNLPQWLAMRQNQSGRGWKVTNSWGQNLEDTLTRSSQLVADLFLETTDPVKRNSIYSISITSPELLEDREFDNYLYNSSFSLKDASRTKLPLGWTDYQKQSSQPVTLSESNTLVGASTVKFDGMSSLSQTIPIKTNATSLTGSVYILGSSTTAKLLISIESDTGSITTKEVALVPDASNWQRLINTIPLTNTSARVQFTVHNSGPGQLFISSPQLEVEDIATTWNRSEIDSFPFIPSNSRFGQVIVHGTGGLQRQLTVHAVSQLDSFSRMNIPTRIELHSPSNQEMELYTSSSGGFRVSFFNEMDSTEWVVQSGKIVQRSLKSEFDVFERLDIRDLRFFDDLRYGSKNDTSVTITPQACAIRDGVLYVVCKEVYNGNDGYVLKIARPQVPPVGQDYLQSFIDFDLKLPLNITSGFNATIETVTSLGFSERDGPWLIINTSANRRFYYRLYFDYYWFDSRQNRMFFLENYTKEGGTLQVI